MESFQNEFYSPFTGTVIIKAKEEGDKWMLYLQASNEGLDQEQEVVMCKALKEASDYFMQHGVISWDHKHKILHDPAFIIGEPLEVAFTDKNETLVKGFLYKQNHIAKNLWDNIQSGAKKLGSSVGGGVMKKSENSIQKVVWDEVAVTHKPVNDGTLGHVQMIPFEQFVKALTAGAGVDAADFKGGRALTGESLQGAKGGKVQEKRFNKKAMVDSLQNLEYEEARKVFDELLIKIKKKKVKSFNDVIDHVLDKGYDDSITAVLLNFLENKLKFAEV